MTLNDNDYDDDSNDVLKVWIFYFKFTKIGRAMNKNMDHIQNHMFAVEHIYANACHHHHLRGIVNANSNA